MSVERLTYQEAELPHLKRFATEGEARANNERIRLLRVAQGVAIMPWNRPNGVKRFHSHEEANADWDEMVSRRVRILREIHSSEKKELNMERSDELKKVLQFILDKILEVNNSRDGEISEDPTNECLLSIFDDAMSKFVDIDLEITDDEDSLAELFGQDGYENIREAEGFSDSVNFTPGP